MTWLIDFLMKGRLCYAESFPYLEESGLCVDRDEVTGCGTTVKVFIIVTHLDAFYYSLYLTHVYVCRSDLPVLYI